MNTRYTTIKSLLDIFFIKTTDMDCQPESTIISLVSNKNETISYFYIGVYYIIITTDKSREYYIQNTPDYDYIELVFGLINIKPPRHRLVNKVAICNRKMEIYIKIIGGSQHLYTNYNPLGLNCIDCGRFIISSV